MSENEKGTSRWFGNAEEEEEKKEEEQTVKLIRAQEVDQELWWKEGEKQEAGGVEEEVGVLGGGLVGPELPLGNMRERWSPKKG